MRQSQICEPIDTLESAAFARRTPEADTDLIIQRRVYRSQLEAPPLRWDPRTLTVSLVWRNHRKRNYERGALAGLGFNSDLPAELLGYDVIGDVES